MSNALLHLGLGWQKNVNPSLEERRRGEIRGGQQVRGEQRPWELPGEH